MKYFFVLKANGIRLKILKKRNNVKFAKIQTGKWDIIV